MHAIISSSIFTPPAEREHNETVKRQQQIFGKCSVGRRRETNPTTEVQLEATKALGAEHKETFKNLLLVSCTDTSLKNTLFILGGAKYQQDVTTSPLEGLWLNWQ